MSATPFLAGLALASAVATFATFAGFDRDRSFYPTVLIVIASYYDLFAVMGGNGADAVAETLGFGLFAAMALLGFRFGLWIVVAGLAGHGVFDLIHRSMITDPGVPPWWPIFCMSYDVVAAAWLAFLLRRRGVGRTGARHPKAVR